MPTSRTSLIGDTGFAGAQGASREQIWYTSFKAIFGAIWK